MERLTFEGNFCDIARCDETPGGTFCETGSCTQRRVWERLKAIEDVLGGSYDLERLRELLQVEKYGRLVDALAERACFSVCEFVCNGKCAAVGNFGMDADTQCKEKILAWVTGVEGAEAALTGNAPVQPADEPEWKQRVMRTFLGGR